MATCIRRRTVTLISRILHPLTDDGLVTLAEHREIVSNLRHLVDHGSMLPTVVPKLIDQSTVANMLGISLSNWKKMERNKSLVGIERRMVGSAIRYRNVDVIAYILARDTGVTDQRPDAVASGSE